MPQKAKSTSKRTTTISGGLLGRRIRLSGYSAIGVVASIVVVGYTLIASSMAATPTVVKTGLLTTSFTNAAGAVMCLDDWGGSSTNDNPVRIYACNRSDPAQIWSSYSDGTIRTHGKCLDVYQQSTANGARIDIFSCNGGSNQRWIRGTNPHISLNNLVSAQSNKCLDDANYGTTNGNNVQLYQCNAGTAQVWGWVTSADKLLPGGETASANCHSTLAGGNTCFYWVQSFQAGNGNFTASGVSASMTGANPTIGHQWPGDGGGLHHSIMEIFAASRDGQQTIELGWYKDATHATAILFATRWQGGQFVGYVENGGTGFVSTSATTKIGQAIPSGSLGNYKIQLVGTQWQVWYNGTEVGYFPQSLWNSTGGFTSLGHLSIYGEVTDGAYTVSTTQMGNGILGSSSGATVVKNYALIGSSEPAVLTSFGEPGSPMGSAYNYGATSSTGFALGGPGL